MKLIIRDDDTNFFTSANDLRYSYGKIWGHGRTIYLAVVPRIVGKEAIKRNKNVDPKRYYPIGENINLTRFLNSQIKLGHIEIVMHGITHEDYGDKPEFASGNDHTLKVKQAKQYLERVFETKVKWFVPPHNQLDRLGFKSVISNKLDLMNVPNFLGVRTWWHRENYIPFIKIIYSNLLRGIMPTEILDFKDHKEIYGYALTPKADTRQIERALERADGHGVVCIATHYWELAHKLRGTNIKLIDYLNEKSKRY